MTSTHGFSRMISGRMTLAAAGICLVALLLGGCARQATESRPPNIVFILADDLGWNQVTCYGNSFYETPNLDRLASEGMKFTDAHAACPVCSPTRASIMTGKYPARLHLTDYIPGNSHPFARVKTPEWTKFLPLKEVTLPELLKPAGYVSGHFGKWHLNKDKNYRPGRPGDPASQGFDDVLTTVKPKSDADPDADPHHIKLITDHAIEFIKANRDRLFFCYVAHNAIHRPQLAPAALLEKYKARPGADPVQGNNPTAGAMVETLDKNVGRIMDTLKQLNLAGNTLVVFFSDNGPLYGWNERKPLYGGKGDLYEGGIREPMIVRWPGVVSAGSTCSEPVSTIDFFPTFAEIAGVPMTDPTVDGLSLLALLRHTGGLSRDGLYWHYPHYHRLTSDEAIVDHFVAPASAIRDGKYKLIEWIEKSVTGAKGAVELYDLQNDPGERENLAAKMPDKAAELHQKLEAWRKSVNAQWMDLNPDYDPAKARLESQEGE